MALLNASHNKQAQLSGAITNSAGTLTVNSAAGFPTPPFGIVVDGFTVNEEVMIVNSWSGVGNVTWSVSRAQDGTGATPGSVGYAHADLATVENDVTATYITNINTQATSHAHTGADQSTTIFDSTAPVKQAFSDAAAAGSVNFAARRDHVHGMPLPSAPNILYNGDFSVAQLGTSSQLTNNYAFLDGWHCINTSSATIFHTQLNAPASVLSGNNLSSYSYLTLGTADTSIVAGDAAGICQIIEGWDGRDIGAYGAAFSGWFFASRPGGSVYSIALRNHDSTWSCVREIALPQSVWTYVTLTFPPAFGTVAFTGNLQTNSSWTFAITLAAGSTYQTTQNVWTNANKLAGTGQTNNIDSAANDVLYMSGLNLIPGQQPQEFFPVPFSQQLLRCKRYRQIVSIYPDTLGIAQATSTNQFSGTKQLEVEMLGTPTMTLSAASHWTAFAANSTNIALTALAFTPTKRMINYVGTVASGLVAGNAALIYAANTSALLFAEAYPT
jgi:hypothetical protein